MIYTQVTLKGLWTSLLSFFMQVLDYYVRCSKTNNHTVREAACTCIAELAAKIEPEAVRPHLPLMLRTLLTCLRDDSWPVITRRCSSPITSVCNRKENQHMTRCSVYAC